MNRSEVQGMSEVEADGISVEYAFVAYLDLLGQADQLRTLERLPRTAEEEKQLRETLARTSLNVRLLRQQLSEHFQGVLVPADSVPAEERELLREALSLAPRFRGFSDSVVVTVALRARTEVQSVAAIIAVHRALLAIAAAQTNFLANSSTALRGGIDVGLGHDIVEGEHYGRALVEAYLLERDKAEYPRVLVGEGLMQYLDALDRECASFQPKLRALASSTLAECRGILVADVHDQLVSVDPMIVASFDDPSASGEGLRLCRKAIDAATQRALEFEAAGNEKLANRYERLRKTLVSSPSLVAKQQ
jgi:hypothetical protein